MNWQIAYTNDPGKIKDYATSEDLISSGISTMQATVPGCFHQDLVNNGIESDYYFSTNVLNTNKYENYHVWYYTSFEAEEKDYLLFGGIDTIAEIYINGKKVLFTENMFMEYEVSENIKVGKNDVVVHILPVVEYADKFKPYPDYTFAYKYNWESIYIRKAPHQYGWDIIPRIVTCGLWKPVELKSRKALEIKDPYIYTKSLSNDHKVAVVTVEAEVIAEAGFNKNAKAVVKLSDGTSEKAYEAEIKDGKIALDITVENPVLWWPKNYGKAFLYNVKIEVVSDEKIVDTKSMKIGIKTVELVFKLRREVKPHGDFCFIINGRRVFLNGTNWVPLDALHITDLERVGTAVELMEDLNCNVVRAWGGNVYESDKFYELCDEAGILVWQDFSMGCAVYPRDDFFAENLKKEAEFQVKRLRSHACMALFAGDNECDLACCDWHMVKGNPDDNTLTREVLPEVVHRLCPSVPYLPSSPYVQAESRFNSQDLPENHLWGPRDYFKSPFYTTNEAIFASETGYFGMPAPEFLRKFITAENVWPFVNEKDEVNPDYMLHCTAMETTQVNPYSYRMHQLMNQVRILFGEDSKDLNKFAKQSQISQAEAMKFFIERFRVKKPQRTGIIWWNLTDGWPSVSDAVTGYYFDKKLAYFYIKRTQNPFFMMIDEPDENGLCDLHAVNDLQYSETFTYTVKDLYDDEIVASGEASIDADGHIVLDKLALKSKHFYYIEWTCSDGKTHSNHYFTDIFTNMDKEDRAYVNIDEYLAALEKCGYDEFVGFDE